MSIYRYIFMSIYRYICLSIYRYQVLAVATEAKTKEESQNIKSGKRVVVSAVEISQNTTSAFIGFNSKLPRDW